MKLRPDQTQTCDALRADMTKASDMQTDAQASLSPTLHPAWAKSDWRRLKLDSKCTHKGEIWRFCQPALTDESQNREPGSPGSESIWAWLNYRDGYRVIPETIFVTAPFAAKERGWWTDGKLYESKVDNNTYTPAQYAANWTLVEGVTGADPGGTTGDTQVDEPEPDASEQPAIATWDSLPANHPFAVGDKFTDGGKTYEVKRVFTKQAHFRPPTLTGDYYVIIQ